MSKPRRSEPNVPAGTFRAALPSPRKSRESKPAHTPRDSQSAVISFASVSPAQTVADGWEHEDSDVYQLTLPPDAPASDVFPDLETALLAAADQVQRRQSQPELPPLADRYRKSRS